MEWSKEIAYKLRKEHGLTVEQAGTVVGIIAEERMNADRIGYKRGYNAGFEEATSRSNRGNLKRDDQGYSMFPLSEKVS